MNCLFCTAFRQNSENSRTKILDDDQDEDDLKNASRRKVTLDPGLVDDLLNFSDEESEFEEGLSKQGSLDSILSHESSNWNLNNNQNDCDINTTTSTSSPTKKRGHQRRHSLTVCETPQPKLHKPPLFETQTSQVSNISTNTSSGKLSSVKLSFNSCTVVWKKKKPNPKTKKKFIPSFYHVVWCLT